MTPSVISIRARGKFFPELSYFSYFFLLSNFYFKFGFVIWIKIRIGITIIGVGGNTCFLSVLKIKKKRKSVPNCSYFWDLVKFGTSMVVPWLSKWERDISVSVTVGTVSWITVLDNRIRVVVGKKYIARWWMKEALCLCTYVCVCFFYSVWI